MSSLKKELKRELRRELKNITDTVFSEKKSRNSKKKSKRNSKNLINEFGLSDNNIQRDDEFYLDDESDMEYGYDNEIDEINYDDFNEGNNLTGGYRESAEGFVESERARLARSKDDNDDNDNMDSLDRDRRLGRNIQTYEEVELENHKYPYLVKISKQKILNNKFDYNIQNNISYAKSSLAFHHWIHASHNKTLEFENFIGKKKVYNLINAYERKIDDYDKSIDDMIESQFKTKVRSRKFSRIYEILIYFNLVSDKNLSGLFIDSNPSNIIQPVMEYRKMYHKGKDSYMGITCQGEKFNDIEDDNEDTSQLKDKSVKFGSSLDKFNSKDKFNFILGNVGVDWDKNNIQEQSIGLDILRVINICMNNLDKKGDLVLKMYETFTKLSLKYLMVLSELFDDVHIIKPLTCRNSEAEKYVICQGFKGNDKFKKELLSQLSKIESNSNYSKRIMIEDIFLSVDIPDSLFVNMTGYNSLIINQHYKTINKMMEFLDGLNYHGELYSHYRERQIEMSEYWTSTFLGKKLDDIRKNSKKLLELGLDNTHDKFNELKNELVGYDL